MKVEYVASWRRYFTGCTSFVIFRWHSVQFTELLCFSLIEVTAPVKFIDPEVSFFPWQLRQNVEFVAGFASVELCIQPALWHCETVQFGLDELKFKLWLLMLLLYAGSIIAVANAVLEFWWQ